MTDITRLLASLKRRSAHAKKFGDSITFVKLEDIDALVEALEKAQTENTAGAANNFRGEEKLQELVNDVTTGKPLTITLPDISSKAFWSGAGKNENFHPETYRRWAKEAIERACIIASIDVEVK